MSVVELLRLALGRLRTSRMRAFLTMLVSTRSQGRTGSVENAEGTSGVKALQGSTERLPQLSYQRVFPLALPRPCVSAHRERRISPSQEGSKRRDL